MPHDPTFWERLIKLHRHGDLHETARHLRHVVEAEPFAMTPRHWLAAVHLQLDQPPLALTHYEKLLTLAVGQGDLFRAIAAQKRIDELAPREGQEARFAALHRWFRLLGLTHLVNLPSSHGVGLTARSLLQMPAQAFAHAAAHATLEIYDTTASRIVEVEALEQRVVLWGELTWDLKLPHGERTRETTSTEGDLIRVDPAIAGGARIRMRPDTPAECLCFDALLIRQLMTFDATIGGLGLRGSGDIVHEERSTLSSKPLQREDLDLRTEAPDGASGINPPRLTLGAGGNRASAEAGSGRDTGEWIDFGTLHLDAEPLRLDSGADGAADPTRYADIPGLDLDLGSASTGRPAPVLRAPTPGDVDDSLALSGLRDPFVEPPGLAAPPSAAATTDARSSDDQQERRGRDRVPLHATAHLRLMGLHGNAAASIACEILDLSPGGIRLSFPRDAMTDAIRMLEHETLRIELDGPGRELLSVAARMRWADLDVPGQVRVGLQFVLMAKPDEQALARLLEHASQLRRVA